MNYIQTDKQRDVLISAANAMLAGYEGEGDAQGISFDARLMGKSWQPDLFLKIK